MKVPPFDASQHDKSNDLYLIVLRSIDDKDKIDNWFKAFYRLLIVGQLNKDRWIRHVETRDVNRS